MSKAYETGKRGEQLAANFLEAKGYRILERNWRFSRAEIDIIAKQEELLIFIEVKTRTSDDFGPPELFLGHRQKTLIADAAAVYMEQVGHDWEIRFDIIAILLSPSQQANIRHYEDAFFPGW